MPPHPRLCRKTGHQLLMMVVGGMVLVIVLAILLPIFDLQSSVG
ncbi:MAG: hypothetical protein RQ750_03760 [Roseovarius sp.]|nr:hypothetical protein [Roseovarius sp.]